MYVIIIHFALHEKEKKKLENGYTYTYCDPFYHTVGYIFCTPHRPYHTPVPCSLFPVHSSTIMRRLPIHNAWIIQNHRTIFYKGGREALRSAAE